MKNKTKIVSISTVAIASMMSTVSLSGTKTEKDYSLSVISNSVDWSKTNSVDKQMPTWTLNKSSISSNENKNLAAVIFDSSSEGMLNGGIEGNGPVDATWNGAYYYNFLKVQDPAYTAAPTVNGTGVITDPSIATETTDPSTTWKEYPGLDNKIDWSKKDASLELGVVAWNVGADGSHNGKDKYKLYTGDELIQKTDDIQYEQNINPTITSEMTDTAVEATDNGLNIKYNVTKNEQDGYTQIFVSKFGQGSADKLKVFDGVSQEGENTVEATELSPNTTYYVWAVMDGQTYDLPTSMTGNAGVAIATFNTKVKQNGYDGAIGVVDPLVQMTATLNNPDNLEIANVWFQIIDSSGNSTNQPASEVSDGEYFATRQVKANENYTYIAKVSYQESSSAIYTSGSRPISKMVEEDNTVTVPKAQVIGMDNVIQPSLENNWKGSMDINAKVFAFDASKEPTKVTVQLFKDKSTYGSAQTFNVDSKDNSKFTFHEDNLEPTTYSVQFKVEYGSQSTYVFSDEFELKAKDPKEPTTQIMSLSTTPSFGARKGGMKAEVKVNDEDNVIKTGEETTAKFKWQDSSTGEIYDDIKVNSVEDNADGSKTYSISSSTIIPGDINLIFEYSTSEATSPNGTSEHFVKNIGTFNIPVGEEVVPTLDSAAVVNTDGSLTLVVNSLDNSNGDWGNINDYKTNINVTYEDGTKDVINISKNDIENYNDPYSIDFDQNFTKAFITTREGEIDTDKKIADIELNTEIINGGDWTAVDIPVSKDSLAFTNPDTPYFVNVVTETNKVWIPIVATLASVIVITSGAAAGYFIYKNQKAKDKGNKKDKGLKQNKKPNTTKPKAKTNAAKPAPKPKIKEPKETILDNLDIKKEN